MRNNLQDPFFGEEQKIIVLYRLDLCRNPARWPDAVGQDDGRGGRQLQHLLQRDGGGEARPQGRLCRPRAHRH
jgi:hypothetical protein